MAFFLSYVAVDSCSTPFGVRRKEIGVRLCC